MSSEVVELRAGLDRLLNRDEAEVRVWERAAFDEQADPWANRLVLCGAGGLGRRALQGLRKAGVEPLAFADNNPRSWGTRVDGVEIFRPHEAVSKFSREATFVVTVWNAQSKEGMADRLRQWTEAGCARVTTFLPLFWKYAEVFLPYWTCDLPHRVIANADRIRMVASLWSDAASLREFCAQIQWRLQGDFALLPPPVQGLTYFCPPFIRLRSGERFVDCGAYRGDTLRDFLTVAPPDFGKYTALEPDPDNFAGLKDFVETYPANQRERIEIFPYAAYHERRSLRFAASGNVSSALSTDGSLEVQGESLDALFASEAPSYIKMDIEGAEVSALRGAASMLRRARPIVAVSAYHLQEHIWQIPELLSSLVTRYSFYLVPHVPECWDLVCYAVPEERTGPGSVSSSNGLRDC